MLRESIARPLDRRRLLQWGGLGLFGLSLEHLLAGRAAAADRSASARSCIFIVASGGLSHIDTFDPKPDAPQEIRGPYQPIATSVPGLQVTEMFPQLAQAARHFTLLRCMSHDDTVHVSAAHAMLTGQHDGSRQNKLPFIGSLISKLRPSERAVPNHVWLHNMKTGTQKVPRYESGLHLVGYENAPLRVGYELDNPSAPGFRVTAFDPPEGVDADQQGRRFTLLQQLDGTALGSEGARYERFRQRARDLLTSSAARQAFELDREARSTRERYGMHPPGQYMLMARRLIEAGVRLVTVTAWPGLAPGETTPTVTQVWDSHDIRYSGNDSMYGNGPFGLKWSLPRLDQSVSALLEDLHTRGLLDETLVVLVSEFGRTPRFEGRGRGRGHWPHCYTTLLAGGGIRGGVVYGSSDRQGGQVASGRPLSHPDLAATVYHALGIPAETRYGPDSFSLRVTEGEPLLDLFG